MMRTKTRFPRFFNGLAMAATFAAFTLAPTATGQEGAPDDLSRGVSAQHERSLWKNQSGRLSVLREGLRFEISESKKKGAPGVIDLAWNDIQQLILEENVVSIVTYQDQRWQLGRDRHYRFRLAESGLAGAELESMLRDRLGDRLVLATKGNEEVARWQIAAKLREFPSGTEGELIFTENELQFVTEKTGKGRRWPLSQISTIARVSAMELLVTAPERAVSDEGNQRSFYFQLKKPLTQKQFQELWRQTEEAHGLRLRLME